VYVPMPPARYLLIKSPGNALLLTKLDASIMPSNVTLVRSEHEPKAEPMPVTLSGTALQLSHAYHMYALLLISLYHIRN
jgi:hypothetical protein